MTKTERTVLWVVLGVALLVGVVWPLAMLLFSHHASG